MEEKTTLMDSLALVISLKSNNIRERELLFMEPTADFIQKTIGRKDKVGNPLFQPDKYFCASDQKKALKRTPGLFPFPSRGELCFLLQFKGDRNAERNLDRPSPLFSRGHFGQSLDDPQGFGLQVF